MQRATTGFSPIPTPSAPPPPTSQIPHPTSDISRPVLPSDIPQFFIPARSIPAGSTLTYKPMLLGIAKVYYSDSKAGVDQDESQSLLCPISQGAIAVDWDKAQPTEIGEDDLESSPAAAASFANLPPDAAKPRNYTAWQRDFADALFKVGKLELFRYAAGGVKAASKQGESEKDFRLRVSQLVREQRDAEKERLRAKYAPKLAALQDRIRRAQQRVEVEQSQSTGAKVGAALSFGAAILGAFMGRKLASAGNVSKAATAMRSAGKIGKESADVGRASENVEAVRQQYADLEAQFKQEIDAVDTVGDPMTDPLDKIVLKPKKTNINVKALVLAWAPHGVDAGGTAAAAW